MISLQKQFLFVHVPKTAGNSIQSLLLPFADDEMVASRRQQDGVERFGLRHPTHNLKKHSTLAEYRAAFGPDKLARLYKFSCVRNPWDRMISQYFTAGRETEGWDRNAFRELIEKTESAAHYLRLDPSEVDPFGNVDFVIRFESLVADFATVCHRLNLSLAPLPAYNRSEREHYSIYYDDELRDLVARRFAADIERFGYVFDAAGSSPMKV